MSKVFITAAPVGALPYYVDPKSLKYLPHSLVKHIEGLEDCLHQSPGWEFSEKGGLVASESTSISLDSEFITRIKHASRPLGPRDNTEEIRENGLIENDGKFQYHTPEKPLSRILARELFNKITSNKVVNQVVLHLTSLGWIGNGAGGLRWYCEGGVESYIPPKLVEQLKASGDGVVEAFQAAGWRLVGTGYTFSSRGSTPYLPITPKEIIAESAAAAMEGAAIIHLHTRKMMNESIFELPWSTLPLKLGAQVNQIVPADYEIIMPELRAIAPLAIVNLSTSMRGGGDTESPLRRGHLKPYGGNNLAPEMCSMSPAEVLFANSSGYLNSPTFLGQQISHCRKHGVRPEIEVFNRAILRETLGPFKDRLSECGTPFLIMLVAGVDQLRRTEEGTLEDDSLIPAKTRKDILSLLSTGIPADIDKALEMTVAELEPIVQEIRRSMPQAKISTLLSGRMQQLLAQTTVRLSLDGVRTGLEDGLSVSDPLVPGGVRKGRTSEQVRNLREELQALGCHVLSAEDTRRVLEIPTTAETLFHEAMTATSDFKLSDPNLMNAMSNALHAQRSVFEGQEHWFLEQLANQSWEDSTKSAANVRELLQKEGLHVRYFIEERDRYPAEGAAKFRNIYDIQSLNYAFELFQEKGNDSSHVERALKELAVSSGIHSQSFLTPMNQRKSSNLRFLEYISFISSSYSPDRSEVLNIGLREHPGYNDFLARLFKAVEYEYRRMRSVSEAEVKSKGFLAFQVGQDNGYIALKNLQQHVHLSHWVVLPSTPTTNYPGGIKLSEGLGATFLSNLKRILPLHAPSLRLLGLVHSGLDEDGSVIVEASMLHNRFLLGTDRHTSIVGYLSRLLHDSVLLPRLVQHPSRLWYASNGMVVRKAGLPLYDDQTAARRIDFSIIEQLPPLRFLAHSSGIATMQQMDNAMRQDMKLLGYSDTEQARLFNRNVVVSFGSASDINCDVSGTPTVDITAYNDIRSMAGTTTSDYLMDDQHRRICVNACAVQDQNYRYDTSEWKLICGTAGKTVLRRTGVFLREDPLRNHDGHSIRRYLEGAPEAVTTLLEKLHSGSAEGSFDNTLKQQAATSTLDLEKSAI